MVTNTSRKQNDVNGKELYQQKPNWTNGKQKKTSLGSLKNNIPFLTRGKSSGSMRVNEVALRHRLLPRARAYIGMIGRVAQTDTAFRSYPTAARRLAGLGCNPWPRSISQCAEIGRKAVSRVWEWSRSCRRTTDALIESISEGLATCSAGE